MNVKKLFDLTGRVAIVSGGSMGLGLEVSRELARRGARVVIAGRDGGALEAALAAGRSHDELAAYEDGWRSSAIDLAVWP